MILAILPGKRGATFVEHAGQERVTAKAAAWTARRTLGEVRCGNVEISHMLWGDLVLVFM
jgi:hypothetical protein